MDRELSNCDRNLFLSPDEEQVGIKCTISKGEPIPAVTKYLLTDFIVNEISQDGHLITLKQKPDPASFKAVPQQKISYEIPKEVYQQISEIFDKQTAQAVSQLYQKLGSGEKIGQWEHIVENMPEAKEERLKVHTFVREKLVCIESNTLDGKRMRLRLNKNVKKMNPASRNKFIHFILFKSNIDTMGAIFKLSKLTGISQKVFSTAGLKDKRGVTTQMVSVFNTDVKSLSKFYGHANKNKEIWIDDFRENMEDSVGVGDLYGNQFGLILRLIKPEDAKLIPQRVESLRDNGMINYFGMQRFGSCGTKTHIIGSKIVKRKWKQVVEDLLLQQTRDQTINTMKNELYYSRQYSKAERALPNKYKIQKNLFKGLQRHGENYQNVFESMPRSIRTLYCHSLQSYMWNRMVTRRIQEHGLKLAVGDLVGKELKGFEKIKQEVQQQRAEGIQKKSNEQEIVQEIENEQKYQVEVISEANLNNYSIQDVVLPLYGPSLNFPKGSIVEKYLIDELSNLELSVEDFTHNAKMLCFKGQYRRMIIKPKNVEYSLIMHKNAKEEVQTPFYTIGEKMKYEDGERAAAQIIIQLPKSSYATMAIRQLLHIPSSFETQNQLNKLYEAEK